MPRADSLYGWPFLGPVEAFLLRPMPEGQGAMLNFAQRNRVVNVLRSVEMHLLEARAALYEPPKAGILFREALDISAERRTAIESEIESALSDIAALAGELELPATEQNIANKIAAAFSVDWADLIDSTSSTLRRYGLVDPGLAEVLDARMTRLSERAAAIAHLYRADRCA
jgi:hypothetical protein